MTVEITIEVPNELARQVQRFRERLPEILDRGLREILAERPSDSQDENAIMELLTSQPTPEQVLSIHPSSELRARISELLYRSKKGELGQQEEAELERHLTLEHLARLTKAHAHEQLAARQ